MPKGALDGARVVTASVKLRDAIRDMEIRLARLTGPGTRVRDILRLRDQIEGELARLEQGGMQLKPERTRIETIDNILYRKAPMIARELRGAGGLAKLRETENPPPERWWWFLDAYVAERQRKSAVKITSTIVALLLVVIAVNYVMTKYFGLDPVEKEARGYVNEAEQYLREGNRSQAILQYERALETLPSLGNARVNLGVLYELEGRTSDAADALAKGEQYVGEHTQYLLILAQAYEAVGELETAQAVAEEAVVYAPDSAHARFVRGGLREATGDERGALEDFEAASQLAQAEGEDAMFVLARMRFGMLLQRSSASGPSTGFGF